MSVDGAIKAICNRLVVAECSSRTSKDVAEQCIKVISFIEHDSPRNRYNFMYLTICTLLTGTRVIRAIMRTCVFHIIPVTSWSYPSFHFAKFAVGCWL